MNALWIFFEVCVAIFEALMMEMLATGFFKEKRNIGMAEKRAVFAGVVAASFLVSYFAISNHVLIAAKTILCTCLTALVFTKSKIYAAALLSILNYGIGSICELFVVSLISIAGGASLQSAVTTGKGRYQALVVAELMVFLSIKIITAFRKGNLRAVPLRTWITLLFLPLISILTTLSMVLDAANSNESGSLISVAGVLGILYSNIIAFWVVESVVRRYDDLGKLVQAETQIALQKEYSARILENQGAIRKLSHDFKHHILGLQVLYEQGNYRELGEAMHFLVARQGEIKLPIDMGNPMLDAVVSAKKDCAERCGIQCSWDISVSRNLNLPMIELCAILGNALDNSIEACVKCPEDGRFLSLLLKESNGALLGEIRNSIGETVKTSGGEIRTTKTDGENHGVGLRSIRECCDKLGGTMDMSFDGATFDLRFIVPIAK